MSTHPLTTFVYETFGQQFGDLLLAGYGAGPSGGRRKLYLTESEAGIETDWVIELITNRPPSGDEPLVLAALLKLLLSRPVLSNRLEFELDELLAELRWSDGPEARRHVEEVICGYAELLYHKQVHKRAGRHALAIAEGGCYHLLTGYVRGGASGTGRALMIGSSVYFDDGFIKGLQEGWVYFAGMAFGSLQTTD